MDATNSSARSDESFDLVVIGGGINGVGIARDAAGRGLKVALCEQSDLASGTSSASTKLIHGGLRYLEYGDFKLVREALVEREVLLRIAPHVVRPMRFVLPHKPGMRPAWMLRLGLFLYDHLGGREILPSSRRIDVRTQLAGDPLTDNLATAFEYSDCWADDSRLVVLNAVDAAERGARMLTRTKVVSAQRGADSWVVETRDAAGDARLLRTRAIVNAAGPWVSSVAATIGRDAVAKPVRLVKGSHLVTKRLFDGEHAYIFQGEDSRIVFAIPYEGDFTLLGTTEIRHESMQQDPVITPGETTYLLDFVNRYFRKTVSCGDVIWTYSGVRPLLEQSGKRSSAVSREYLLDLDNGADRAPVLTVYGGKLTAFRTLAERAVGKLQHVLGGSDTSWTSRAHLPGGDIPNANFGDFEKTMQRRYAWLGPDVLHRLLRAYGTRVETLIGQARKPSDLGADFGHGLYEAEIEYLCRYEFAHTVGDVLWRRSKLGLRLDKPRVGSLHDRMMRGKPGAAADAAFVSPHT